MLLKLSIFYLLGRGFHDTFAKNLPVLPSLWELACNPSDLESPLPSEAFSHTFPASKKIELLL